MSPVPVRVAAAQDGANPENRGSSLATPIEGSPAAKRAGIPRSAHSLRHTFATRYLAAHPHEVVGMAQLLGHHVLDTTRIYVKPTDEELAARVDRIDLNVYGR